MKKFLSGKITLLNMISSLILQVVTIISGFIIPKIILKNFGSEINGLISSLTQFLNYITLIEGGISGVIIANLYKPLLENDINKISAIVNTAKQFYKKIGYIFIIYTFILATFFPLIFKNEFSYFYIFSLTIILSISLLIQYMFTITYRNLLNADQKVYVVSLTQSIITIINVFFVYISVKIFPSIHFLKIISGILYLVQPYIFYKYVDKKYKIKKDANTDKKLIASRWDGFAINIASFIHNSTDIAILTIFTDLSTVSIYSVYALVSTGLKQIISSLTNGMNPKLGSTYASGNVDALKDKLNLYEYIVFMLVFLLFTTGALLITPFVLLYTRNINDANYNQPIFGVLILLSEAIYLLKLPHLNLAYSSNRFKDITKPAFIEAIINISISIILVIKYGMIGVCIGTIISMIYRMIFHIWYTKKIISDRNQWEFYKKLLIFIIVTSIGITVCLLLPKIELNIINWFMHAIVYVVILFVLYIISSLIFFKKELLFLKNYLIKRS